MVSKSDVELQKNIHSMEEQLPLNAKIVPFVSYLQETMVGL